MFRAAEDLLSDICNSSAWRLAAAGKNRK